MLLRLAIDTQIMVNAQIFHAVVVQLEHRFYGETHPLGDLSDGNLQYLSSEQASGCRCFLVCFSSAYQTPFFQAIIVHLSRAQPFSPYAI